jgi:hypothetical protein
LTKVYHLKGGGTLVFVAVRHGDGVCRLSVVRAVSLNCTVAATKASAFGIGSMSAAFGSFGVVYPSTWPALNTCEAWAKMRAELSRSSLSSPLTLSKTL